MIEVKINKQKPTQKTQRLGKKNKNTINILRLEKIVYSRNKIKILQENI